MRELILSFLPHFYTILFLSSFLLILNSIFSSFQYQGKLQFSKVKNYLCSNLCSPGASLFKEDIIPSGRSPFVYRLIPYLMVAPVLAVFFIFPLNENEAVNEAPLFLVPFLMIFWLTCISSQAIATGNFFSTIEAVRKNYQTLAVILNIILSIISVVILSGTSLLSEIVNLQKGTLYGIFPGFIVFKNPFIFVQMVIFFISVLQIMGMSPFGGVEIGTDNLTREFHGLRWWWIVSGKWMMFILMVVFGILMFWGGWTSPFESSHIMTGVSWAPFWLNLKTIILFFCLLYVRYRFSDFSMRKTLYIQWRFGVPLSVLLTLLNIGWRIFEI